MAYDRLADGIQKHAKLIIVAWVVILVAMAFFAMKSDEVMSYDMNDMAPTGSESLKGYEIIADHFPTADVDSGDAPILVLPYDDQDGLTKALEFLKELNNAAKDNPNIQDFMNLDPTSATGPGILMVLVNIEGVDDVISFTPDVREFIAKVMNETGYEGEEYVTGSTAIGYDMQYNSMKDIEKIDPFTILMILLLIGLFFRSVVTSATPPMTIGVAFVVTMGLIFFIGHVMNIFFITNMIILVSMMGAGCDYCIFIIARYREELRKGLSHDEAVHLAIVWAGESISISGASVIIGFGAMAICDYSLVSTMGICLALGILIALLAALTLIPSILQLVGDRIFWPTRQDAFEEGGKATKGWYAWCGRIGAKYFDHSARFSIKHAKAIAIAAVLISIPAVYIVAESEDSYDMITAMLSGESGDGMEYIAEYADQGMVMPNYSIIEYKEPIANIEKTPLLGVLYWTDYWENSVKGSLEPLYSEILTDENISYVERPFDWNDTLKKIDEAGITDPIEKVEFIKNGLSVLS